MSRKNKKQALLKKRERELNTMFDYLYDELAQDIRPLLASLAYDISNTAKTYVNKTYKGKQKERLLQECPAHAFFFLIGLLRGMNERFYEVVDTLTEAMEQ